MLRSLMSCDPCAPRVRIFSHNGTLGEHEPCGLRHALRPPEGPRGTAHRAPSRRSVADFLLGTVFEAGWRSRIRDLH